MRARILLLVLAAAGGAAADDNITVVRKTLELEREHTLLVDHTMEYILQFVPSVEQSAFPMRVWFRSDAGDVTRPLLLTARQRTGAITWQLPYLAGASLQHELQRTLCPDDSVDAGPSACAGSEAPSPRGEFSLHVASSCAAPAALRLRAEPATDWRLLQDGTLQFTATLSAPHVNHFQFSEEQDSVRLVVASPDDSCATVAVQDYTCPIAQTAAEVDQSTQRMTVRRSGGVQLSKSRYPRGFYVIALVSESEAACSGEEAPAQDWLWEAALFNEEEQHANAKPAPIKRLIYEIKPALSRGEYLVGAGATLAFFLAFYVVFGALVLAERWPRWYNCVAPRAVLADPNKCETGAMREMESSADIAVLSSPASPARRLRRDSNATFDSSDASDTDSEGDEGAVGASTTTVILNISPGTTTPGNTSPVNTPPENNTSTVSTSQENTTDVTTSQENTTDVITSQENTTDVITSQENTTDVTTSQENTSDVTTSQEYNASTVPTQSAEPRPNGNGVALELPAGNGRITTRPQEATLETLDEVDETTKTDGQVQMSRPFGLPARLHVAALSRRRGRVLRARSQRYLYTLYTVAVFYALPVVQFVAAFQVMLNVSGSLDLCYYNFLCAHPVGALSDFNHVFSNLGYLLLGALFMLQLRRRKMRRKRHPRDEEYGIPAHYGLASSLGAGMMVVALLSASYHVCPNRLNFQFDTAFMYVLAVLSMVKIYQSRHPDINARAHATFAVLAVLIALVVWGVLGGGPLFWSVFTVLHVFTFLLLSLRIYYVGQFRLESESLAVAARALRQARPLYLPRLVALLVANAANWAFALYGLVQQPADIASHLLFVLLCNALLHIAFYLCMKLLHGERPRWYAWLYLGGAAAAWAPALYYFTSGSTDWAATPAQSREANHECRVLRLYDAHDLWHMLSAVALYLTFNALLTWDDGLAAVKRTEIAVF